MLLRPRHACRWAGARRAFSASVRQRDPYKVLGVERTVTREKVQQAYLQKAMEWHPDCKQNNPQATERMKELNRAKELVLDSIKNGGKPMAEASAAGTDSPSWPGAFPKPSSPPPPALSLRYSRSSPTIIFRSGWLISTLCSG